MSSLRLELLGAQTALLAGGAYLSAAQRVDGFWSDYDLPPGKSEAWTTACAGYALLQNRLTRAAQRGPVESAVAALTAARRDAGWGYNRATACDADSSSWSVRFLCEAGVVVRASTVLERYLTSRAAVRTFSDPARFGTWAREHDEVTPLAGLAMLAAREHEWVERIRRGIVDRWHENGGWRPFWWTTRTYVVAQNLEFLSATGGIPREIADAERRQLRESSDPSTSDDTFDRSQLLLTRVLLGPGARSDRSVAALVARQRPDGSWDASRTLRVPNQSTSERGGGVYSDRDRILGTSLATIAIARWVRCRLRKVYRPPGQRGQF